MRKGLAISAVLHAVALLWGMITFNASPFESAQAESIPVDFISAKDFSELTAGQRSAPKPTNAKPLVEKIAEEKAPPEEAEKITEKKEIAATATEEPPPAPEKEPEPKPKEKPKAAEKEPEKAEKAEKKADPIAEALKKDEQKKEEEKKKAEATPLPPRKRPPPPDKPKFDPSKVAALLDKREAQRHAATGSTLNQTASLGAPTGRAPELSQSELDALRARLMQLWNPPIGIRNAGEMIIRIRVLVGRDGRLTAPPQVITSGHGNMFESARDSAVRAVFRAQPFDMLRQETYETWRDMEITFDPRDMFRG